MLMNACSTEFTTARLSQLNLVWPGSMTWERREPQIHVSGRLGSRDEKKVERWA